jgi:hypothetical protein
MTGDFRGSEKWPETRRDRVEALSLSKDIDRSMAALAIFPVVSIISSGFLEWLKTFTAQKTDGGVVTS